MKHLFLKKVISEKITGDWGNEGDKINVLRTTNFTNEGVIDFSNVVTRDIPEKVVNRKKLIQGDVIIEKSGGSPSQPVGRVVYFERKDEVFLCNNFTAILRSNDLVFPKYLFYFLFSLHKLGITLKFQNKTTGIINLQLDKYLERIQIPVPPLLEQKRIAEILDKADALRQNNKQLLATYDELLQATFLDMFGDPVMNPKGWKEVILDSTISKIQIGPFGSQLHKSDYLESGIPLINPTNIKENKISIDEAAFISEDKYDSMPQYHLFDGDVIMARRGDLSKVALVRQNGEKMFCGTGSLYVRFSEELNKFFLFKLLSHEKTINFLEKEARGVTMPNLNKNIIKRIPIFLPPITLQNHFAQIVENIEAQKALIKLSLQESEDLFNGLVQEAFRGSL